MLIELFRKLKLSFRCGEVLICEKLKSEGRSGGGLSKEQREEVNE